MPLINFGSILTFAEEVETQNKDFYTAIAQNPECAECHDLFAQFVRDAKKNIQNVQRTRRENVTEMILEQIRDFTRDPFCESYEGADAMNAQQAIATALQLEGRAVSYYGEAAKKLKAMSEVSRALKALAKKHTGRYNKLKDL
jgi:rubrerythrin